MQGNSVPFNVKFNGSVDGQQFDMMQQVNRANNKILYEDPLERKRRERELRIQQERIELA